MKTNSEFSKLLLESSTLKTTSICCGDFESKIIKGHGSIVEFENKNRMYDLRPYFAKPIIGHGHPLILKEHPVKETNNRSASDIIFFEDDSFICSSLMQNSNLYFNFYTYKNHIVSYHDFIQTKYFAFIDKVLIQGKRVAYIKHLLKENLVGFEISGLSIRLENSHDISDKLFKQGIFHSPSCTSDEHVFLYLPTAITDFQIKDFCQRLLSIS